MPEIHGANHVLDRIALPRQVQTKLKPQVELLREILDYGSDTMKRLFVTGPRELADIVVMLVVFRQIVVMLDSVEIQLREAAVYASQLALRALVEASWALEWILTRGRERWARQYMVGHLRKNRNAARKLLPGSPEHAALLEVTKEVFPGFAPWEGNEDDLAKTVAAADELLAGDDYREINDAFEALVKRSKLRYEPNWFEPSLDQQEDNPRSIRQLAERIGRTAEYDLLYVPFAGTGHGSRLSPHVQFSGDRVVIEPIRSGDGFRSNYQLGISIALRTYMMVLEEYRPGELPAFRRRYLEIWQERFMNMPEIKLNEMTLDI